MIYLELFITFLKIGLFSIGGGYAAIPLIQEEVVYTNRWLSMTEFTNLVTIAEMTPGPIAINSATFVGVNTAGFFGGITATFATILPSCIILSVLSIFYQKYKSYLGILRPVIIGLISSASLSILLLALFGENGVKLSGVHFSELFLFLFSFLLLRIRKINPIFIIFLCGMISVLLLFLF